MQVKTRKMTVLPHPKTFSVYTLFYAVMHHRALAYVRVNEEIVLLQLHRALGGGGRVLFNASTSSRLWFTPFT